MRLRGYVWLIIFVVILGFSRYCYKVQIDRNVGKLTAKIVYRDYFISLLGNDIKPEYFDALERRFPEIKEKDPKLCESLGYVESR